MTGEHFSPEVETALGALNAAQLAAVEQIDGPALILAGPGSGKTTVLTARMARILQAAPSERFRVLALTFTNKAGAEMMERVTRLLGGARSDRAFVGTFHAFCTDVLQNHGAQIGLSSSFQIFNLDADREAVLSSVLAELGETHYETRRFLQAIDRLRSRLILPEVAARYFREPNQGALVAKVYGAYRESLQKAGALDFGGLLFETWRLFETVPALAERYRRTYRYWLIDEFQDTNRAQYGLLRSLAGPSFRNIFAVADDDQIIYRWNGASYAQIDQFRRDFSPTEIQLPTNYRCPPDVVAAANALISHNRERTPNKGALIPGKRSTVSRGPAITVLGFANDVEERAAIAERIAGVPAPERAHVVVLARTKALLEQMKAALEGASVKASVAVRRDNFVSAPYIWMQAVLRQLTRPQDERNLQVLISAFEAFTGVSEQLEKVIDLAADTGKSLLHAWVDSLDEEAHHIKSLAAAGRRLVLSPSDWRDFVRSTSEAWPEALRASELPIDVAEDAQAWAELSREITSSIGRDASLDEFLHRLDISSKEPTPASDCVRLMTIHGAKGKEFRSVYLVGLAEGELPSWQSLKPGADAELEEERRNCFVAITRTEEELVLSYAERYRGYAKAPSRFLTEMGVL